MKNLIEVVKSEEEQVEQIKQWLRKNGIQIIVGIVLGIAAIWGWNAYNDYLDSKLIKARSNYLLLVSNPNDITVFNDLKDNYADTDYMQQSLLLMAKNLVAKKDYQQALDYITPLFTSKQDFIVRTAKLRAANIYLEIKGYEKALSMLEITENDFFSGLYNNAKGDIYIAMNNFESAKTHYRLALEEVGENSGLKNLIQIKLNDIN